MTNGEIEILLDEIEYSITNDVLGRPVDTRRILEIAAQLAREALLRPAVD